MILMCRWHVQNRARDLKENKKDRVSHSRLDQIFFRSDYKGTYLNTDLPE